MNTDDNDLFEKMKGGKSNISHKVEKFGFDYYKILDVDKDTTTADIKKKYRVKAKKRTNVSGDITIFLTGKGYIIKILSIYGVSQNQFTGEIIINFNEENEYREKRVFKVTDAY
jgi:hypothetical protein